MSSRKKKWVESAFRQISLSENTTCAVPNKKRITRHSSAPILPNPETIKNANNKTENTRPLQKRKLFIQEDWLDIFAPHCGEELAVHTKKIAELEQWLLHCQVMERKQPAQLCLLTGPPGCGKTTTVRILATEFGYHLQEWVNPIDQEVVYNLGDQGESYINSQMELVKNFLFKASRYKSIVEQVKNKKCLLMMEDFPNFLIKDAAKFHEILKDYRDYGKAPLIFIATDAKNRQLNINCNLFTDQIKQEFLIQHINFNSIAATLMHKAMKRFTCLMQSPQVQDLYTIPSQDVIDSIVVSSQGDIRSALINLHYSALTGSTGNGLKVIKQPSKLEMKKSKKLSKQDKSLEALERNESTTMMHTLGRVFNPKYLEDQQFVHSPETIVESLTHERNKIVHLLHTNYLPHFRAIEHVASAADGLTISDLLMSEYRDDAVALYGLNIAIRNLMVANKQPVPGWLPVKGSKRLPSNSIFIPNEHKPLLPLHHNISKQLYVIDYSSYVKVLSRKPTLS